MGGVRLPIVLVAALLCAGCAGPRRELTTPARFARGVVFVLPGIEGRSRWNANIANGLGDGGVKSAIRVWDWTTALPGGFMVNLAAYDRNVAEARRLAAEIVAYRDKYPGRPVHLVGHSGGGGIVALTLAALPPGRQIDGAILLAPALSQDYDLTQALLRTQRGIHNFYSEKDVTFLKLGTSLFGNIDREGGAAAGAVGFRLPPGVTPQGRELYTERLRQVRWTPRLSEYGANGSHTGWASRKFAKTVLAEILKKNEALRPRGASTGEEKAGVRAAEGPGTGSGG